MNHLVAAASLAAVVWLPEANGFVRRCRTWRWAVSGADVVEQKGRHR